MQILNFYEIFNVLPTCSKRKLKKKYQQLKQINKEKSDFNEYCELLTIAFNILKNPISRLKYDELFESLKGKPYHQLSDIDKICRILENNNQIPIDPFKNIIIEI